ncbi:hypothetical protein DK389_21110 [Methylobacterium durans]|uniref:FAD-dependent oxidoreductase 2 FAD-binding domain-containing protein n=2 Tax=Methylobacterium durans TaxID=2202825 RepID=A0A2U8WF09_9HYPH|nr:hypothetical protein DK389_21110 [Methylobacterium durans]
MVRAYLIVERAIRAGLIDGAGRDLLVIGAGASGITAAIHAADRGVRTVVVEREPAAFVRQRFCLTRDIDPTLYDWPLAHWRRGHFPWSGPPMPLGWTAARANAIALGWEMRLRAALTRHAGRLDVRYGAGLDLPIPGAMPVASADGYLDLPLRQGASPTGSERFGALVSCVGFGGERCTEGGYTGSRFWESDQLEARDLGLPGVVPRVLVSGGGDGALQDFIRVVTAMGARQVYERLCNAGQAVRRALDRVERIVQGAEDQAQRTLIWNVLSADDEKAMAQLERAHEHAIAGLRASPAWATVDLVLAGLIRNPMPATVLAHDGACFSRCYALNRFLALLLLRLAQERGLPIQRRRHVRVASVTPVGHAACASAASCHGLEHDVEFVPAPGVPVDITAATDRFEVVVIRHGLSGPLNLFKDRSTVNRRHLLPYHLTR